MTFVERAYLSTVRAAVARQGIVIEQGQSRSYLSTVWAAVARQGIVIEQGQRRGVHVAGGADGLHI